jgi:Leucine rich repeat
MKETDPTILEGGSSPIRNAATTMVAPIRTSWSPLKEEKGPSPVEIMEDSYDISPMQHLMDQDQQGTPLAQSDAYEEPKPGAKPRRKNMMMGLVAVVLLVVIAAVVLSVLLLRGDDSTKDSSKESSSTNDPPSVSPPTMAFTSAPVKTKFSKPSTNDLLAPFASPSVNGTNSTSIPTTVAPVALDSPPPAPTTNVTAPVPTVALTSNTSTPIFISTELPTPVQAPTTVFNDGARLTTVLRSSLLEDDFNLLADSLSLYNQAFLFLTSSDTYYMTTANITDLKIFQRYLLLILDLALPAGSQLDYINPVTDHCSWSGVVCNTNTTDTILDTAVTEINWTERKLAGTLPDAVKYLTTVIRFDLGTNNIQGSIPNALYNMTSLQYLYLHGNQLTGSLSSSGLLQLSLLEHLYVGDNRFTGTLPQSLGSPGTTLALARPLKYLSLYNNSFGGTIPKNWNLRYMFYLDLGYNDLTGSIPADWVDDMFDLRILYLSNNRLSGSFPTNFTEIGNNRLWFIDVSSNALTGIIPGGFSLRQLDGAAFQNNDFSSMDTLLCRNVVFNSGEMVSMRSDCGATCPCDFFCSAGNCY